MPVARDPAVPAQQRAGLLPRPARQLLDHRHYPPHGGVARPDRAMPVGQRSSASALYQEREVRVFRVRARRGHLTVSLSWSPDRKS